MFAFVSAFPKSLHCTDEAQQAETVLSADRGGPVEEAEKARVASVWRTGS